MNRRHTVVAALIASAALTVATVATTAGAQSAPRSVTNAPAPQIPAAAPEPETLPPTANPMVASQLAREAAQVRLETAVAQANAVATLQAFHAAALQAQQNVLAEAHAAVQGSEWACIRVAESGDNYSDTSGAYGILVSSWDAFASVWEPFGNFAVPGEAPAAVQDLVAYHLYEVGGGFGGWHDRCTGT